MKRQSRAKGIAISYVVTAVRSLSKLLLTPIYLRILGLDDYGFYQYIFSIASYVTILDFGIALVINTFSIKYREAGDNDGVENVMFYTLAFTSVAAIIIAIFGAILIIFAPTVFGSAIVGREVLARKLLGLMILELIMLMFQHYFEGVILASEKYVTLRSVDLTQILIRCAITLILLFSNVGVMSIALGDFLGVGLCLSFEVIYSIKCLELKAKYHYRDRYLLRGIAKLSLALCLQSLIVFLNSSIDKYVLGRYLGTVAVTIYTVALTFSMFFDELSAAIQRLYLPQVVKLVSSHANGEELTSFVIIPGRYQFALCGGALGGFILFGKHFIEIWSGRDTLSAWAIALYLMVPSIIPLIENICLSILTAMNKRLFRSYVLGCMAIANLLLTIFLVKKIGIMGAPIGTCISLVLGNNIVMNWYYKRTIGINVGRLIISIMKGILPCVIVATIACLPLTMIHKSGILWFLFECFVFIVVYAVLLWLFGLNADEKKRVAKLVHLPLKT